MIFALRIWGGFRLKCLTLAFSCVFEQKSWCPSAGQMWQHRATGEDVWGEVGEFQVRELVLDGLEGPSCGVVCELNHKAMLWESSLLSLSSLSHFSLFISCLKSAWSTFPVETGRPGGTDYNFVPLQLCSLFPQPLPVCVEALWFGFAVCAAVQGLCHGLGTRNFLF